MSDEDVESRSTSSGSPAPAATVPFPPDRFHLTYGVTFLAGVGTLLPWNVFITERADFDLRLFVPPYAPAVADAFESVFGMTFMAANILGLALLVRGDALSRVPRLMRVPAPLLAMAVLLAASGALAGARETRGDATAGATLLTLLCLGGLTALVQAARSRTPAACPEVQPGAHGGQAAAGVATPRRRWRRRRRRARRRRRRNREGHSDQKGVMTQASVYFYVSACVMLVCALGCAFAARFRSSSGGWKPPRRRKRDASGGRNPGAARGGAATADAEGDGAPYLESLESESLESESLASVPLLGGARLEGEEVEVPGSLDDASPSGPFPSAAFSSGTRACYRFAAFATFAVTLAVFPAVTSSVCAAENGATSPPCLARASGSESRFAGDLWTPSLFLLFNAFDLAGRAVASVAPRRAPSGRAVLVWALARFALVPPLLACIVLTSRPWLFPGSFRRSDAAPVFSSPRSPSRTVTWERERDVGPDVPAAGRARGGRRGAVLRSHRGAGVRGARVVRARGGDATVG